MDANNAGGQLEFWYDFASPYSYIAAARICGMAPELRARFVWKPFLLGPIFKMKSGGVSAFQNPSLSEQRYRRRDVERLCERYGLPLRWPTAYPRGSLLATRVALIAAREGWCEPFTRAAFHANFALDRDIGSEEVVRELVEELGMSVALLGDASLAQTKALLAAQVEAAIAQHIFGAPSFVVRGELFWGSDRLEQAIEWSFSTI